MLPKAKKSKQPRGLAGRAFLPVVLLILALAPAGCKYSAEKTLARATDAWRTGDYKQAAQLYEQYLQRLPTGDQSREARLKLANLYYLNLHDYEKALDQYKEYLNQAGNGPDAQTARERMAEVLGDLGRSYQAISEYEMLDPADETERRRIRLRIADLYFDEKNFSQALTEYEKVTEGAAYDPLSERAILREASIYQLERSQFQQAIPFYQKIVANTTDPKTRTSAMFAMSDCYAALYQFDQAIQTLRDIKGSTEQSYITERIGELEGQKREQQRGEMARPAGH